MTEFPRAKLERLPMQDKRRFKLKVRSDQFSLADNDGSLHVWLDRGDVSNLSLDCSHALLDDDMETGENIRELVG